MSGSYDHIIIGSGINSLVCAAMLAKKGSRVLVLEREEVLGGCMRTSEVTIPGFHHDVMAATFVLFLTGPAYQVLGEDLAKHGLEFCHTKHPTAVLRPDGSSLILSSDRQTNITSFNAIHAGDGDQHLADMTEIEGDADFLFSLLGGSLWSIGTLKLLLKKTWRDGVHGTMQWIGKALSPARAWLEADYQSSLVQALWAPWVLHTGLTPESTYGAQMGKVIAFATEAAGTPIVKGGAGQAAKAFEGVIKEHAGDVLCHADVDRVITKDGSVTGVVLQDGTEYHAQKSVICSVAPGQLYNRLLRDAVEQEDLKAANKYRHGRGNFQMHYALDCAPDWIAEGLEKVALLHLSNGIDAVSKTSNEAERGMLPVTPTICVGQPHTLDPSRCPEGKAILWIQVPDAPSQIKGDAAGEVETQGKWTEDVREAFADRIEAILAGHIKDFRATVLARKAYSPADLAQMNVNLVNGDPYGGACSIDQFFLWRPFSHSRNGQTAFSGLYHIGASTHPGPGLSGGSGYLLAKKLGA